MFNILTRILVPGLTFTAIAADDGDSAYAVVSSRRFKDEIKPMDKASETILALKPVTFRYKKEIDPRGALSLDSSPRKWKRWIPIWWLAMTKARSTPCATKR